VDRKKCSESASCELDVDAAEGSDLVGTCIIDLRHADEADAL